MNISISQGIIFVSIIMLLIFGFYFNAHAADIIDENKFQIINKHKKIKEKKYELIDYEIPDITSEFKAYMCYTMITDKDSPQYKLQEKAYTDELGFRKIGDDYLIAVGSFYAEECGDKFEIELSGGRIFTAIISEAKSNYDPNSTPQYHEVYYEDGTIGANIIEFIVNIENEEEPILDSSAIEAGSVSCLDFEGDVLRISKFVYYSEGESK